MSSHYITLPCGHRISLAHYRCVWVAIKAMDPAREVLGWDHFATPASSILRDIQAGVHDRINRHLPWFNHGRKWSWEWQATTANAARALNTPRLAIHWLPYWLKPRFEHRLARYDD